MKDRLLSSIAAVVGDTGVLQGDALRTRATSYWDSSPMSGWALVRPADTAELSQVMALCHQWEQPVVVQGGLTGCVEGAIAADDELIVSLERMTKIEEIDPIGQTAVAQAGVVLQTLQETVAEQGLYFAVDLGARGSCTIGGNVATNAGGINVIRYGMMREQVLGLEAVLADGTVLSAMNKMLKNNAGYDLKSLFVGTEGTLGIVTRAVLRLQPQAHSRNTALLALPSIDAVTRLLGQLQSQLSSGLTAFEVMWGDYVHAVTEPGWHCAPMARDYPFYVLAEASGVDPEQDDRRFMAVMESLLASGVVVDAVLPKSEAERRALWSVREDFEAILQPQPTFLYDVSLPIRFMGDYVEQVKARLRSRWPGSRCYVMGHMGDGNLHLFISPNGEGRDLFEQADEDVYGPLAQFGGSISAEHGIGLSKRGWLPRNRSASELALMKTLKQSLDPKGLLNPGKVLAR